jgi:negative regulator of flagellin synthesis FlgM
MNMKIDGNNPIEGKKLFNKVQDLNKNQDLEKKENAQKTESDRDKVSLSEKAKEINELKALIDGIPEIRSDKVDAIKKAIDAGTYNFDSQKIAQKILEEEI